MLGRTANGIFWMFRYLERAENTARLLDAGLRMALTRGAGTRRGGMALGAHHARPATRPTARKHGDLHRHPGVQLHPARQGQSRQRAGDDRARRAPTPALVRTAITRRGVGGGQRRLDGAARPARPAGAREQPGRRARRRSAAQSHAGARGDGRTRCCATRSTTSPASGTFIERADNTARILDVKYYLLLPSLSLRRLEPRQRAVGHRCCARSSGERAYRWLNAGRMDPRGDRRVPDPRRPVPAQPGVLLRRSCARTSASLARDSRPRRRRRTRCCASRRPAAVRPDRSRTIFEQGLHQFLDRASSRATSAIASAIAARLPVRSRGTLHAPRDPPHHPLPLRRAGGARPAAPAADAQGDPGPGDRSTGRWNYDGAQRESSSTTTSTTTTSRWSRSSRARSEVTITCSGTVETGDHAGIIGQHVGPPAAVGASSARPS